MKILDKIETYYYNWKNGIKNIIKWFPIIIKDRNWDYYYTYNLLRFKFENQAKYLKDTNICVSDERNVEILETCIRLIDKLKDDEYQLEYQDCYNYIDNGGWLCFHGFKDEQRLEKYFYDNRRLYNKIMTMEKPGIYDVTDEHAVALYIGMLKHEKAKRLLFKILDYKFEHFWN